MRGELFLTALVICYAYAKWENSSNPLQCEAIQRWLERKDCAAAPQPSDQCKRKLYTFCKKNCTETIGHHSICSESSGFKDNCTRLTNRWEKRNCTMKQMPDATRNIKGKPSRRCRQLYGKILDLGGCSVHTLAQTATTTEAPTTVATTSEAPTTEVKTTETPTMEATPTEAPTTVLTSTEAPTTVAISTEAPTTVATTAETHTTEASKVRQCQWEDHPGKAGDSKGKLLGTDGVSLSSLDACKAACRDKSGCVAVDFDDLGCFWYDDHVPVSSLYQADHTVFSSCNLATTTEAPTTVATTTEAPTTVATTAETHTTEASKVRQCQWEDHPGMVGGSRNGILYGTDGSPPSSLDACKAACRDKSGCVAVDIDDIGCFWYDNHVPVFSLSTVDGSVFSYCNLATTTETPTTVATTTEAPTTVATTAETHTTEASKVSQCQWEDHPSMGSYSSEVLYDEENGQYPTSLDACKAVCEAKSDCVAVETKNDYVCFWYSRHVPVSELYDDSFADFSSCKRVSGSR